MRIGIVHNENKMRDKLRRLIQESTAHQVIWTTNYGDHALKLSQDKMPDLIILDVEVVSLEGVAVSKKLMSLAGCPILLVTHDIGKNSFLIFEAMAHGALDVAQIPKDGENESDKWRLLHQKISQLSFLVEPKPASKAAPQEERIAEGSRPLVPLIVLGASTGGPLAIASIVSSFPRNLEAAVVALQHVDEKFSRGFVDWLSKRSHLPVQMIEEKIKPRPGVIYVSNSKYHLIATAGGFLAYSSLPDTIPYRPSINVFFESLAKNWPRPSVAVLLTGMGADGAEGLETLKNKGWYTIAEDEESCAVFGMPKAAIALGAAKEVLNLTDIPLSILSHIRKKKLIYDSIKPL